MTKEMIFIVIDGIDTQNFKKPIDIIMFLEG